MRAVFIVQFHMERFATGLKDFIEIYKLIQSRINPNTIVFPKRFQDLPNRVAVPQFCLEQPDEYQGRETCGKMGIYVFFGRYINRTGSKIGFGHFKGILNR